MAVSKPSPKSTPMKYMSRLRVTKRSRGLKKRPSNPRRSSDSLRLCSANVPFCRSRSSGLHDVDQHERVDCGDNEQESRRNAGAGEPAQVFQARKVRANASRAEHDGERQQHHDGRMPEREEQPDADRPLSVLHQLPRDVVDRTDVVGIHGVAQTERVGEQRRA